MFPTTTSAKPSGSPVAAGPGLAGLIDAVHNLNPRQPGGVLLEQIGALERLKEACAAAQARLTYALAARTADAAAARHLDPAPPAAASPRRSR